LSVVSVEDGKVRVEYQNTFTDDAVGVAFPSRGWVVYDTTRLWAPVQYSFTFGNAQRSVTRERKDVFIRHERYPIVASSLFTEVIRSDAAREETRREITHDVRIGDRVREEEFTLSAFGLPEPVGTSKKNNLRYAWFLIAAGVLAVVSIIIRYFARRRAAPAQP
jgi:hypothetical protein